MVISNFPEWNETGTEPDQGKKDEGWKSGEKPPADWFNWLFGRNYLSLQELDNFIEQLNTDFNDHSARHADGGADALDLSNLADGKEIAYTDSGDMSFVDKMVELFDVNGMYMRHDNSEIYLGIDLNNVYNIGLEYRFSHGPDGLLLLKGAEGGTFNYDFTNPILTSDITLNGTFNTNSVPSVYTTNVGDSFEFDFTGKSLMFKALTEDRGGLWKFHLDNGKTATVSCYEDATVDEQIFEVFKDLPYDTYHCKAIFQGEDPANPPASTPARGYLFYDPNGDRRPVIRTNTKMLDTSQTTHSLLTASSIPDFAISAKPDGSAYSTEWVPAHFGVSGVADTISRKILLDGRGIVDDIVPTYPSEQFIEFERFEISQSFKAINPNGPTEMWTHFIRHTIKKNKPYLTIQNSIDITTDVYIGAGYFGMLPVAPSSMDTFRTNAKYEVNPIPTDGSRDNFGFETTSAMFAGEYESGRYCGSAIDVNSMKEAAGYGSDLQPEIPTFITYRADDVAKFYYKFIEDRSVLPADTVYSNQARIALITGILFPDMDLRTIR